MLNSSILLLLTVAHCNVIVGIPQRHFDKRSLTSAEAGAQVIVKETVKAVPVPVRVVATSRKKKGPTSAFSLSVQHQLLVPNLHVIPISGVHRVHDVPTVISHSVAHANSSVTRRLLPVLVPLHNHLVPVPIHDLTVIPLHGVLHDDAQLAFKSSERRGDEYRTPLGGYGAGWYYGGHGAGHGFHYSYG